MAKVAADYGISDVALKKICQKHRIPAPRRGYWAKKAAGKKVSRTYLRQLSNPVINKVLIHGSAPTSLAPEVREAKTLLRSIERKPANRVVAVLNAFVGTAESRGYRLKRGDDGLLVEVDGESIPIVIEEKKDRVSPPSWGHSDDFPASSRPTSRTIFENVGCGSASTETVSGIGPDGLGKAVSRPTDPA